MIAFLGMGLLGSNFVRALRNRKEEVRVWNRTAVRAKELEAWGALAFPDVRDAVRGADRIHLTLKDDESVDQVLEAARSALQPGALIIDHTTTSVEGAIGRTKLWKSRGFSYQHAPVFMGPANALEGSGYMLVSGDQELIGRLEKILAAMTGKLIHFGPEPGRAAAMKLIGNCFLVGLTASLGDALALAQSLETPVAEVDKLFASWNPAQSLTGRIHRISGDDFSKPSWELAMARKDTGLFLQAAQKAGVNLEIIPSIASVMDAWIEKGFANHDWMIMASRAKGQKG